MIECRKNHAMSYCNDYLFVTGGVDSSNKLLDDLCSFDIKLQIWNQLKNMFVPKFADSSSQINLTRRSNHTIVTKLNNEFCLRDGIKVYEFISYMFGGKMKNEEG